ncbi:MAG TPA: hypothetical protein RMH99_28915, partial [Sandaracinaceae bacterium LLY-WYZ-13_1]|nr:hypothetical protein [Sandaracinaceae bacterium LLY-WYZ-13_1]
VGGSAAAPRPSAPEPGGARPIPRTDPPAAVASEGVSRWIWGVLVLVAGLAVSVLTAVIVWVALTVFGGDDEPPAPSVAPAPVAPDPTVPHPEPMEPLEVHPPPDE